MRLIAASLIALTVLVPMAAVAHHNPSHSAKQYCEALHPDDTKAATLCRRDLGY